MAALLFTAIDEPSSRNRVENTVKSLTRREVSLTKIASWLMTRSPYLATERKIPKKRTITIATPSTKTGGCCAAIVISQALETVSPVPPTMAKVPSATAAKKDFPSESLIFRPFQSLALHQSLDLVHEELR